MWLLATSIWWSDRLRVVVGGRQPWCVSDAGVASDGEDRASTEGDATRLTGPAAAGGLPDGDAAAAAQLGERANNQVTFR